MIYINVNEKNEEEAIKQVVETMKNGEIAIIPTDTVYGIAADALNEKAVKKIYEIKRREFSKPCNILVSDIDMIRKVTKKISIKEEEIIKEFFPRSLNYNI